MNMIYATLFLTYCACIHLNYRWFKELMKKEEDQQYASFFWVYIFSGPILTGFVVYKMVSRRIIKYRERKAIKQAIKSLPEMLKQYNITIEDGDQESVSQLLKEYK